MIRNVSLRLLALTLAPALWLGALPARAVPPDEGPSLWIQAEALWLERQDPDGYTLAQDDGAFDGRSVMDLGDIGFGHQPGARLSAGMDRGPWGFEVIYTGLHDWSNGTRRAFPDISDPETFLTPEGIDGGLAGPLGDAAEVFEDVSAIRMNLETEFHSFELNLRRRLPAWRGIETSLLAGFRFLRIDEDFAFRTKDDLPLTTGTDIGLFSVDTENNVYGLQIGGAASRDFHCGCLGVESIFRVGGKFKGGFYGNTAEQHTQVDYEFMNLIDDREDGTTLAGVVEAGVLVEWSLAALPALSLVAGYDMIHVAGLAVAREQLGPLAFDAFEDLDSNSSILFHGPFVGLRFELAFGSVPMPGKPW